MKKIIILPPNHTNTLKPVILRYCLGDWWLILKLSLLLSPWTTILLGFNLEGIKHVVCLLNMVVFMIHNNTYQTNLYYILTETLSSP